MKKIILGLIVFATVAVSSWAQEAILREDRPDRYTVVPGDTLWDISDKFLQNPWMWPEIWHVNPQIDNPHLIYPGDIITLIYLDGRPRLTVERGEERRVPPGTVRLSPKVRVIPLDEAIPTIPLDAIDKFLSDSRIVEPGELEEAPYVVAGGGGRLISGAGDTLYARGEFPEDVPVYGVYRKGDVYVDPDTGEILGIQARDIGTVGVREVERDIATTNVTRTTEEIRIGDRLMTAEQRPLASNFWPSAPEADIEGKILAVEGGVTQVGKMDVVMINRGEREGMGVGNVLAVYKAGRVTRDQVTNELLRLPQTRAGLVMVFRTFEKMSFGLVLEAEQPLAVEDFVRNP